jgi:glycosyltransferase involved in cell wall biosynthesis
MTRVGWLADQATFVGGAELTQAEFRNAAPTTVHIVDCMPGHVVPGLDVYVVHNCVTYTCEDFDVIGDGPAVKYHHDVGPHIQPAVRSRLAGMRQVCCSPVQAEYMELQDAECVPPPVDLRRFRQAASERNGDRSGVVSVASWRNHGKAPHRASEWAQGVIDFYGSGTFAPDGSREVAYDVMASLLARYETFVFLPTVIEPFGRLVAEAWAAGCRIVTNRLVGARWWIEEAPDKLDTAGADFWRVVLDA